MTDQKQTTLNKEEYTTLNAIAYGMDTPGAMYDHCEALIPGLIGRGFLTARTIWELTDTGEAAVQIWERNQVGVTNG